MRLGGEVFGGRDGVVCVCGGGGGVGWGGMKPPTVRLAEFPFLITTFVHRVRYTDLLRYFC